MVIGNSCCYFGYKDNVFGGSVFANMYGACGGILQKKGLFFQLLRWGDIASDRLIAVCAGNGHCPKAYLRLFSRNKSNGVQSERSTYVRAIDICARAADLATGREIHASLLVCGWEGQRDVGNALIRMYGKCGELQEAENVFARIRRRNVSSWNALIAACNHIGQREKAVGLVHQMKSIGIKRNQGTFVSALDACRGMRALDKGREIHAEIMAVGLEEQVIVGTALMKMYSKCGALQDARDVFHRVPQKDAILWTAMISACSQNGYGKEALAYYNRMKSHGFKPTSITFVCALDACAGLAALQIGLEIHAAIVDSGCEGEIVVGNALVNMYGKCGHVQDAKKVFDSMLQKDVVSWNAMVAAYTQNGLTKEALELIDEMALDGFKPNCFTFVAALDACASLLALEKGREIHSAIINNGCERQVIVATALLNMYGKCGSLNDSRNLFVRLPQRDAICWNAMIAACAQNGHGKEALQLFHSMQIEGVLPNQITFVCALDACAGLASLEEGQKIHACLVNSGYVGQIAVDNALINMYGKCQSLQHACSVFSDMRRRDVISWNAMVAACAQNGQAVEALDMFQKMQVEGVKPDHVTFVCALDACADLAALEKGQEIHAAIESTGLKEHVIVNNALINMYGKCGHLSDARNIFQSMRHRDIISWNTMIAVYGHNGHGDKALDLFNQMKCNGFMPNQITFLSVLTACNHMGCVDDGRHHFTSMSQRHWIAPQVEHTVCMIDILGRAGHLDEAERLASTTCYKDNKEEMKMWLSLLASCRVHGDVGRGTRAATQILKLDPENPAVYVLLSNTYAGADKDAEMQKLFEGS